MCLGLIQLKFELLQLWNNWCNSIDQLFRDDGRRILFTDLSAVYK